jgi:hypothetical protein
MATKEYVPLFFEARITHYYYFSKKQVPFKWGLGFQLRSICLGSNKRSAVENIIMELHYHVAILKNNKAKDTQKILCALGL